MADKTDRLLKSMSSSKSTQEERTAIGTGLFLPNHSGDHSKGIVLKEPQKDKDIANKKYVDYTTANLTSANNTWTGTNEFQNNVTISRGTVYNEHIETIGNVGAITATESGSGAYQQYDVVTYYAYGFKTAANGTKFYSYVGSSTGGAASTNDVGFDLGTIPLPSGAEGVKVRRISPYYDDSIEVDGSTSLFDDGSAWGGDTITSPNSPYDYSNYIPATSLYTTNATITTSQRTPLWSGDTGTKGEICFDSNYLYICVDSNTWKRVGISW